MPITMPRVVQTPSPNYTPSLIAHDLFFVHMCEGGGPGSVAWLCRPEAQASANMVMSEDGATVWQLVQLQFKAWAQCAFNSRGISLEIPGFTAQGIPEARWRAAALIAAWCCRAYDIPVQWAQGGQGRGLCQHVDLGAAGGGHVDACAIGGEVWHAFLGFVKEAYEAFGTDPLPAFALHGAPNPHEVVPPPNVPPEPSHGGAPRIDPVSPTNPPDGSDGTAWAKWTQEFICAHGKTPINVDGDWGVKSRNANSALLLDALNLDMKR